MDSGVITLTAQNLTDGQVSVTPASPPVAGRADCAKVPSLPFQKYECNHLYAEVSGNDLIIHLDKRHCKTGGQVTWISYD